MDSRVAEARAFGGKLQHPFPKALRLAPDALVAKDRSGLPHELTGSPLAHVMLISKVLDGLAAARGAHHFFDTTSFKARMSSC